MAALALAFDHGGEARAFAATASLYNVVMHVDWNQASIDSDHVTREGNVPGDYVQWDPRELFYLHDWNVIDVPDGTDYTQILCAQQAAREMTNGQPTAIVYRTTKGWRYGIEGSASHGAGSPPRRGVRGARDRGRRPADPKPPHRDQEGRARQQHGAHSR